MEKRIDTLRVLGAAHIAVDAPTKEIVKCLAAERKVTIVRFVRELVQREVALAR